MAPGHQSVLGAADVLLGLDDVSDNDDVQKVLAAYEQAIDILAGSGADIALPLAASAGRASNSPKTSPTQSPEPEGRPGA